MEKSKGASGVAIVRAKIDDYERIKELVVGELHVRPEIFTKENFTAAIESFGKYYLVARKDDRIVGFISGFDDTGIFYGYMGRLVVDQKHRNQGVGTMLAEACLAEFRTSGVASVIAGVGKDNVLSLNLLRKSGFKGSEYLQLMHQLR
jgi:ribosomal protein S18 acetylase RimI-like enzyme